MDEVLARLSEMSNQFVSLWKEVEELKEEKRARSRSPVRKSQSSSTLPTSYADAAGRSSLWSNGNPSERIDCLAQISFPTSDDEMEGENSAIDQLVEVSENTCKLLTDSCSQSMGSKSRKKTRSFFCLPKAPATQTPRLDHFMRTETPQASKSLDRDLVEVLVTPPVESSTMVCPTPFNVSGLATPPPSTGVFDICGKNVIKPTSSNVQHIKEGLKDQGLSEQATSLIVKSWRTKTNRSYDSLFKRWGSLV